MLIPPAIWSAVRPVVFLGWLVAAARFGAEVHASTHPDFVETAAWIAVYYLVPAVLVVRILGGAFDGLSFWRFVSAVWVIALLCWALPNAFSYTYAQFEGWNFGRFMNDGSEESKCAPLQETTLLKLGVGVGVGVLTHVSATVWCAVLGFVLGRLPRRFMRGKA